MSVREEINRIPKGALAIAGGALILVAAGIWMWASANGHAVIPRTAPAHFSADDGKSYFTGQADQIPPFDQAGKTVFGAAVYRCSGTPFVAYLVRYKPEARDKIRAVLTNGSPKAQFELSELREQSCEVKRPGETAWKPLNSREGTATASVAKCPDGKPAEFVSP